MSALSFLKSALNSVARQLVDRPGSVTMSGYSCRAGGQEKGVERVEQTAGSVALRWAGRRREHAHFPTCGLWRWVWGEVEPGALARGQPCMLGAEGAQSNQSQA